jgi:hypothetical protein
MKANIQQEIDSLNPKDKKLSSNNDFETGTKTSQVSETENLTEVIINLSSMRSVTASYKAGGGTSTPLRPYTIESVTQFKCSRFRWIVHVDDPELEAMEEDERNVILAVELHQFLNRKKYFNARG